MINLSYTQKRHSKAYQRHQDFTHAKRKANIVRNWGNGSFEGFTRGGQVHRLSKGKIHCSCPMCREKTKERGWKHSDLVNVAKGIEENEQPM